MAPKPSGKKPTGAGKSKSADKGKTDDIAAADDSAPTTMAAPKNKEEVLAQINLDGLPNCPAEQILEICRSKYEPLVHVFIHYCKFSDCKTMESSTRLKLGARTALTHTPLPRTPPRRSSTTPRGARRRARANLGLGIFV